MEKELIKKYKEGNVSETSIEKYIGMLRHLGGAKKLKDLDFLADVETVKTRAKLTRTGKAASDATYKSRLTTVLTTLRVTNGSEELRNQYKELHDEVGKIIEKILYSGVKNQKQIDNDLTKEQVVEITTRLKLLAEMDDSKFDDRQNYLIWSLYSGIIPRRNVDYWLMDVIDYECDWTELPTNRNYYMVKQKLFVYNQHKNTRYTLIKGKVETQKLDTCDEMLKILSHYIENLPKIVRIENNGYPLLGYKNGVRHERKEIISETLNRITGKNIGTNMMRHIYSEHNAPPREELDKVLSIAAVMGHNFRTHTNNYIRKTIL